MKQIAILLTSLGLLTCLMASMHISVAKKGSDRVLDMQYMKAHLKIYVLTNLATKQGLRLMIRLIAREQVI